MYSDYSYVLNKSSPRAITLWHAQSREVGLKGCPVTISYFPYTCNLGQNGTPLSEMYTFVLKCMYKTVKFMYYF